MKTLKNLSILLLALVLPFTAWSQTTSDYVVDENSSMIIAGTSTLHDWEADVEEFSLESDIDPELMKEGEAGVSSLRFTAKVESIESGKGKMNSKIYDALKEEEYPEITFELTEATLVDSLKDNDRINLDITGTLNVAGVENTISFPVEGMQIAADAYRFDGTYSLEMEDYDVDRPSAMLGTIKAGGTVDISFSLILNSNNEATSSNL
jgi:polyisoprenoid-binding protein YceI